MVDYPNKTDATKAAEAARVAEAAKINAANQAANMANTVNTANAAKVAEANRVANAKDPRTVNAANSAENIRAVNAARVDKENKVANEARAASVTKVANDIKVANAAVVSSELRTNETKLVLSHPAIDGVHFYKGRPIDTIRYAREGDIGFSGPATQVFITLQDKTIGPLVVDEKTINAVIQDEPIRVSAVVPVAAPVTPATTVTAKSPERQLGTPVHHKGKEVHVLSDVKPGDKEYDPEKELVRVKYPDGGEGLAEKKNLD